MRTTLTIDDDLLAAARSLARDKSESIGEAVSELIRRGLRGSSGKNLEKTNSGFPVFHIPPDSHPITLDDVRRAADEP